MSDIYASGKATALPFSDSITLVVSAADPSPTANLCTSTRRAAVGSTHKACGAPIDISSDEEDTVAVRSVAVRSRETQTASERLNSSHIPTTTRVPFAQAPGVYKDVIGSRTRVAPPTFIERSFEVISGVVLGAVLMWFYLAFS